MVMMDGMLRKVLPVTSVLKFNENQNGNSDDSDKEEYEEKNKNPPSLHGCSRRYFHIHKFPKRKQRRHLCMFVANFIQCICGSNIKIEEIKRNGCC
ncbi:hypothetical protein LINGRAHAP2_LOCUS4053, partial [Linum grandiflorum]